MTLITAVDSAYPFNYAQRPADCKVIMGYVGRDGYTPHVWTIAEVQAARATGCQWWPIGVGISGGVTNAQDGHDLASVMIARLPGYGVTKTTPVFQDLEPNALHANMATAQQCVAAWKADMHAAGYPNAYTYSTDASFIDWVARWDNVRPTSLPAGKIGVQYGGAASPPDYDISVFDGVLLTYAGGDDMPLSDDDKAWIDQNNKKNSHDQATLALREQFSGPGKEVYDRVTVLVRNEVKDYATGADLATQTTELERAVVDAIAVALAGGVPVETIEQGVANALEGASIPVILSGHAGTPPVIP